MTQLRQKVVQNEQRNRKAIWATRHAPYIQPLTAVQLDRLKAVEFSFLPSTSDRRKEFMKASEAAKRELSWDEPVAQTIALYERIITEARRQI